MRATSLFPAIAALLLLAGCGGDPDAPATGGEAAARTKAVADVDGALGDMRAPRPASPAASSGQAGRN